MRRIALVLACLALLWAAAPAEARSRASCFEHIGRGEQVLIETKYGVVWHQTGRGGQVFGCLYSQGRQRRLPNQTTDDFEFIIRPSISFDGRFVAYGAGTDEPAADVAPASLVVYDLKMARRTRLEDAISGPEDSTVTATVVKANGAVAWIGMDTDPGGELAVQKIDRDGQVQLDRGTDIDGTSLAKARSERRIYWLRGGSPLTAPLR